MRIYILDRDKITKFNLPKKVSGAYVIDYLPVDSKIRRSVNVEAQGDKWIIKSNGSVDVVTSSLDGTVELQEYNFYQLRIKERNDILILYCMPSVETTYKRYRLNQSTITIGSSAKNAIQYNNKLVMQTHIQITKQQDNWYIQAAESDTLFAYMNDIRIKTKRLKVGDVIFLYGLKIIWMGDFIQVNNPQGQALINSACLIQHIDEHINDNSQIEPVSEEDLSRELYTEEDYFFHTPRLKQSIKDETITIDAPPTADEKEELPFLLTIGSSITMLSSTFITAYSTVTGITSGQRTWGQSIPGIVMCVAMIIGTLLIPKIAQAYSKKRHKEKEAKKFAKYNEYLAKKQSDIKLAIEKETQVLHANNPPLQECYSKIVSANKAAIWTKEINDDDFLTVRLGTGTTKSKLDIRAPQEHFSVEDNNLEEKVYEIVKQSENLENVPVTFSFTKKYISAIICNIKNYDDFLNGLFLQLMGYHSSLDLKIVFLLDNQELDRYNYAKYSPHCLSEDKSIRFYATNMEETKKISAHLETEFTKRKNQFYQENGNEDDKDKKIDKNINYKNWTPYYLIVTNNYSAIKNIPIVKDIIESKDNLGFAITILDNSLQSLPNECSAFIELYDTESCVIEKEINNQTVFKPEILANIDMRMITNRLANIPVEYVDEASQLPTSLTFLEMFKVARIEQLNILNRWKSNDPTISLKTPIGVHTNGDLFILDLHEKEHGPHGLIAGSTGSGKSEFIITFLLSMAVNYHPDEVQFVLIDYKGGGLAGAFENRETNTRIPHVVGTITNLDVSDMNRTLVSINSELKRRQQIFNDAKNVTGESTIDIYKYQHYYREGVLKEPVSHLFIVSDEFAELKAQQPEFMNELISAARIGRSLGVHLILATQKPSGVVNDQIWSNTKFRVCLKVADRGDSMEVLKKPDAASLKEAGRFYLQVGYDEYFDIGQSGWAGAKYIPTDAIIKKVDDTIHIIDNVGNTIKTLQDPIKINANEAKGDQLTNIVKHIVSITEAEHYEPKKLWLDKIPDVIFINDLKTKYNYQKTPNKIIPIIGEYDNPSAQMQDILSLNITDNNTLIYGMANSGKESLLQTMIYSIITTHTPEDINLYILDFGAETLKSFSQAPQIGDVCTINDEEKILNLLIMVDKELDRRKELFVDYNGNYNDYLKLSQQKLPLIHIIINNNEGFNEQLPKIADLTSGFFRDSSKYGITFTITTGASNSFRMRLAEYFQNKLCLQMANDTDYRNILNCDKKVLPAKVVGRGVSGIGDIKYEFQTAYIDKPEKIAQTVKMTIDKLKDIIKVHAKRIPVLPDIVSVEHIIPSLQGLERVPIGVDVNSKEPHCFNFIKNKVTAIVHNGMEENIPFFNSLFTIIKQIPNTRVRVIDLIKKFDISKIPVDYHMDNYEAVLKALVQEIDKTEEQTSKNIYFISGISKLKSSIVKEPALFQQFFEKIINSKNSYLIITDDYESYKKFQLEPLYRSVVPNQDGIWIGEGINTQVIFKVSGLDPDLANASFPDMAFSIEGEVPTPIKKVVRERDETDEK